MFALKSRIIFLSSYLITLNNFIHLKENIREGFRTKVGN